MCCERGVIKCLDGVSDRRMYEQDRSTLCTCTCMELRVCVIEW